MLVEPSFCNNKFFILKWRLRLRHKKNSNYRVEMQLYGISIEVDNNMCLLLRHNIHVMIIVTFQTRINWIVPFLNGSTFDNKRLTAYVDKWNKT